MISDVIKGEQIEVELKNKNIRIHNPIKLENQ